MIALFCFRQDPTKLCNKNTLNNQHFLLFVCFSECSHDLCTTLSCLKQLEQTGCVNALLLRVHICKRQLLTRGPLFSFRLVISFFFFLFFLQSCLFYFLGRILCTKNFRKGQLLRSKFKKIPFSKSVAFYQEGEDWSNHYPL